MGKLQKVYDNKERVKGFIVGKAKAGLYVKIMGTNAFYLLAKLMLTSKRCKSFNKNRGNI